MSYTSAFRHRAAAVCLMLPLLSAAAAGAEIEFAAQFARAWRDSGDADILLQNSLELAAEAELWSATDKFLTASEAGTTLTFSAESSLSSPWVCSSEGNISISDLTLAPQCGAGLFQADGELSLSSVTLLITEQTYTDTTLFIGESGITLSSVTIDLSLDSTAGFTTGTSYTLFETGGAVFTSEDLDSLTLTGNAADLAELSLADGGRAILLTFTPEPGSTTLSLMALTALLLRRRRAAS